MNAALAYSPVSTNRWWIYQRERFPIVGHGLLIAAFSFSAVSFSWLLRGGHGGPSGPSVCVAFVTAFVLFLQLRIADEFKDFEEDSRIRPYRPVPRGLVTLRELAVIGGIGAIMQFALALWLAPKLIWLLLLTWGYLALMTREFFVREWIREKPITYLWTHMLIIPLTDFYAAACDWRGTEMDAPPGLFWFIAVSFFNGIAIEIGRKIRSPQDEEEGVRTYSYLWGRRIASAVWLGALLMTGACAIAAARQIHFQPFVALILGCLLCIAAVLVRRFLAQPVTRNAKVLENFSGLWTIIVYLSLGAFPLVRKLMEGQP